MDWCRPHTVILGYFGVALLIYCHITNAVQFPWLNIATVSSNDVLKKPNACDQMTGLSSRQKSICRRHIELMDSVRLGAKLAIDECQWQFKHRRWNCTTVDARSVFGPVMNLGTRETAFVYAMASSGVAWAVTRACSSGNLDRCGCDLGRGGRGDGFEWSGCSDNIHYGIAFSSKFVDAREKSRKKELSEKAMMNLHNNMAGRKAIEDFMRTECKCHGVSGSCEMKTCWRKMPPYRIVGETIKERFDGATEVRKKRVGRGRYALVPKNPKFKPHTISDLVYLVPSPDFCEHDPKSGSLGTKGRYCNRDSAAIDGCDLLCCGRGFKTTRRRIEERCKCKFYWCCHVKCKKCVRVAEFNTCL